MSSVWSERVSHREKVLRCSWPPSTPGSGRRNCVRRRRRRSMEQLVTSRLRRDALWFAGRHWREIGWQDWQSHPDAFYAFVPEAFVFYLPSALIGAMEAPQRQLLVGDSLIGMLDRSPQPYHWDAFLTARLVGLEPAEYEAMKAWVLSISGAVGTHDEDSLTRAYETIDLLGRETVRLRNLLRRSPAGDDAAG